MAGKDLEQAFYNLEKTLNGVPLPQRETLINMVLAYIETVDSLARTLVDPTPTHHDSQQQPITGGSQKNPPVQFACPCCQQLIEATCITAAQTP